MVDDRIIVSEDIEEFARRSLILRVSLETLESSAISRNGGTIE